jgi:hypothetical protein
VHRDVKPSTVLLAQARASPGVFQTNQEQPIAHTAAGAPRMAGDPQF